MTINVIINGANGKMGQMAVTTLMNNPEFNLVGKLGRKDNLAAEIKNHNAHVVLDLTDADSVFKNTQTIIEADAHPVIGTTGLLKDQIHTLQKLCEQKKLGGIIAPNFSLGALLMMKCAQEAAKYFSDIEIIEMHHNGKLESPSGTSIRTAELLTEARSQLPKQPEKTKEILSGARGANYQHIPIHSVRLPGLVAHQQIIFGGTGETLTIRHDSIDRQSFMPGVVVACKKVVELNKLIYGLELIL